MAPAEGAAEEFQVGDTCNASAAQKQLWEVILLRGTGAVLVDFPFRLGKSCLAKVAPFRRVVSLRLTSSRSAQSNAEAAPANNRHTRVDTRAIAKSLSRIRGLFGA